MSLSVHAAHVVQNPFHQIDAGSRRGAGAPSKALGFVEHRRMEVSVGSLNRSATEKEVTVGAVVGAVHKFFGLYRSCCQCCGSLPLPGWLGTSFREGDFSMIYWAHFR